jgi:PilZ domain-containing protein
MELLKTLNSEAAESTTQRDAAINNNRAFFDDWTATRPAHEWPARADVSTSARLALQETPVATPEPAGACRRQHKRVDGPFDGFRIGALETPIQLYDLSRGGCFINSMHQQQPGVVLLLKIELPYEGWISVKAESLPGRGEFGFAVRFVEMNDDAAARLERAVAKLAERAPHDA